MAVFLLSLLLFGGSVRILPRGVDYSYSRKEMSSFQASCLLPTNLPPCGRIGRQREIQKRIRPKRENWKRGWFTSSPRLFCCHSSRTYVFGAVGMRAPLGVSVPDSAPRVSLLVKCCLLFGVASTQGHAFQFVQGIRYPAQRDRMSQRAYGKNKNCGHAHQGELRA